jgi:formate dehydrogenase iron-sulfur subunit
MAEAAARVETLRERGVAEAQIYGDLASGGTNGIGGLNAIFVLNAPPETFNLPAAPSLPADRALPTYLSALAAAAGFLGAAFIAFGRHR